MKLSLEKIGDNQAPAIVFIHGNSSSSKIFDSLESENLDIIKLNLPGHGDHPFSSNPNKDYTFLGLKSFIQDQLGQLKSPFLLCGNSLGGHLAIDASISLKYCKGLVIFGAPPIKKPINPEEAFLPNDALAVFLTSKYEDHSLVALASSITTNPASRTRVLSDFRATDPVFRDIYAKSVLVDGELADEVQIVESLAIPVYIIHGMNDPTVNLSYIRSIKNIEEIYEIENCGHYPSAERPDEFTAILNDIIARVFS